MRSAAWVGDVAEARRLIAAGADANARDQAGLSAFLLSAGNSDLDLLDLMLANGGDLTGLDRYQRTGMMRAATCGHAAAVARLARAGVDVDQVNRLGWTALHEAIVVGDGSERYRDVVAILLLAGPTPNWRTRRG